MAGKSIVVALLCLGGLFVDETPANAQDSRLSIGIQRVDDLAQTQSAEAFAQMMENALVATGRFRVVERTLLTRPSDPTPPSPRSRRARRQDPIAAPPLVDYVIEASIASVGARARTNIGTSLLGGVLSGLGLGGGETHCSNHEATMVVDVRVLHSRTREVRHLLRTTETQRAGAACNSQSEIDVPRLLRAAANRVASDLVTSIYPIQIAAIEPDGTVILNYGTGTIQPDAAYAVVLRGQPITDPASGRAIGHHETRLGFVRIREVAATMSRARPIGQLSPQVGALLRPANRDEIRAHEREENRRRRERRR